MARTVLVAGAGIFGVTAARALAGRGWRVTLCDPSLGPTASDAGLDGLPDRAESTDISKVVRLDYGSDLVYIEQMERALAGWRAWRDRWEGRGPLFHEQGVLFLSRGPLVPGGFEAENIAALAARGHRVERLGVAELRRRFPAWNAERYPDGYYNPQGGYAESGRVVGRLLSEARALDVEVRAGVGLTSVEDANGRVNGGILDTGERVRADAVVVATGSWTSHLLPWLGGDLRSTGQPVFHLRPEDPSLFHPERFPVFGADISTTGWYGFPVGREGVVKIANHGPGREMHPDAPEREVTDAEDHALRAFLAETFPALLAAPIVKRRTCVYGDSRDQHFWIAPDPERHGLVVAAGGSGHGFKFAPLLGDWIADAVEGRSNVDLERFRWRPDRRDACGEEEARAGR